MKARNTKTGDVVRNFGISKEFGTASYIDSKGKVRFSQPNDGEWEIVDEEPNTDIFNFRVQAAIAAMQGILSGKYSTCLDIKDDIMENSVVYRAILLADALITELKKGE